MSSKLVELRGKLDAKRKTLHEAFEQAGADLDMDRVTMFEGDSAAKAAKFRALNDEMADLGRQVDDLAALEGAQSQWVKRTEDAEAKARDGKFPPPESKQTGTVEREFKSLGQRIVESQAVKGYQGGGMGPVGSVDAPDLKTLMTTSAGWAPETIRTGRVVEYATRPLQVIDLIPMGNTGQAAVVYMEETTFTNAAAETAEAGTYAESALALTEQSSTVRKIATFLPVTDEQLEDVAQVEGYINTRLVFMLRQRLDSQILVGNGTPPNLRGFLNTAGIQTQAKGADPTPDAIYKAMTLIRVTGRALPSGVIMHPTDWQDVKLLRTADGIYIWGSPSEAAPDRIWGLPVAQSDAITLNTALVGDFATHTELVMRRDVDVQVSNSHGTYFIEGKQAIRADMRAALVVYRPAALCTVTGV